MKFSHIAFLSSTLLLSSLAYAEPMNLETLKKQLIAYHDSGEYMNGIAAVDHRAELYLQQRVNQNKALAHPKKLAVVFDIDETSLSNYPFMYEMDFGGTDKMFGDNIAKGKDLPIKPTLQLYQLAEKDKVAVFFITGRPQSLRSPTVKNLDAAGYYAFDGLFMKPDDYKKPSIIPFKSGERQKIEAKGYDVVLSVGDQFSDLNGGYDDARFKLPNPYYYIP